eukprot:scaffold253128_cov37-Prasinocladus_malaysianus.AAC.1
MCVSVLVLVSGTVSRIRINFQGSGIACSHPGDERNQEAVMMDERCIKVVASRRSLRSELDRKRSRVSSQVQ